MDSTSQESPVKPPAPAVRTGARTSEFRLALLAVAAGLVLVVLGLVAGEPALQEGGLELVQVAAVAYVISRGVAKAGGSLFG